MKSLAALERLTAGSLPLPFFLSWDSTWDSHAPAALLLPGAGLLVLLPGPGDTHTRSHLQALMGGADPWALMVVVVLCRTFITFGIKFSCFFVASRIFSGGTVILQKLSESCFLSCFL